MNNYSTFRLTTMRKDVSVKDKPTNFTESIMSISSSTMLKEEDKSNHNAKSDIGLNKI
jgi:hypothetical protein